MREEKKYLVEETSRHLGKSNYVFLVSYDRVTVMDVAELRKSLSNFEAEFHVVKNSILKHAAGERSLPAFCESLTGQTAIVVGGKDPAEVAKVLVKFHKEKEEKCPIKVGVLDAKIVNADEIVELSKLPTLEILRAQFLGLLNTPAQQTVRIMQAVPEGLLNVLQAKVKLG